MKEHKSKRVLFLIFCVIIFVIATIVILLYSVLTNSKEDYIIQTGDKIDNLTFIDSFNSECDTNIIMNNTTFAFYISDKCSPCLERIPSINILGSIFNDGEQYNTMVIWRDSIPKSPNTENMDDYCLKDVEISNTTPTYYIFKDSKVIFMTQDLEKYINKSLQTVNDEYIKKAFNSKYNPNGDLSFIFIDEGCDEINMIDDLLLDRDDVVYVTSDNSLIREGMHDIYDPQNALAKLLKINYYPMVLSDGTLLNLDSFIGNIT